MTLPTINGVGFAVADPELKFTKNGQAFTTIRIACSQSVKTESGKWEQQGDSVFFNVQAWGEDAERAIDKITKGSRVSFTGVLSCRNYTDKNGIERHALEVKQGYWSVINYQGAIQPTSKIEADPWQETPF